VKKRRIRGFCKECGTGVTGRNASLCRTCWKKSKEVPYTKKEYRRNWQLKKKYKFETGEFDAYWCACRGKCFICERNLTLPSSKKGLKSTTVVVDHNHKTKKVRGLLCSSCNKGLGFFRDDLIIIKKAVSYLGG
jgi:hypothetical protein